jgi:hypothetical protein
MADDVYIVVEGRARLRVVDEEITVGPGSVVSVDHGEDHQFVDITEDLELSSSSPHQTYPVRTETDVGGLRRSHWSGRRKAAGLSRPPQPPPPGPPPRGRRWFRRRPSGGRARLPGPPPRDDVVGDGLTKDHRRPG